MKKNLFAIIFIIIIFISCSCSNIEDSKDMSINKALEISTNYLNKYFDVKIKNTSNEKLEIINNDKYINYNFSFLDDNHNRNYHILFNDDDNYTNFSIYYDNLLQNKTISYEKALDIANNFVEQKFSNKNIKILESNYFNKKTEAYEYNFFYTRMHDDIPYDENGVNITIDASSKITYLSLDWDNNLSFPQKDTNLNEENINKLFFDKIKLNLSYMDFGNSLVPVYQIDYNHGFYLDASTKKIINPYNNIDNKVCYDVNIDDLKNNSIFDIKDYKNNESSYNTLNIIKEKFIPKEYKFSYKDNYKNYKNHNVTNYSYSNSENLASISFNHSTNEVENIFIPIEKKSILKGSNFDKKEYTYKKALYYISLIGNNKLNQIDLNAYNYNSNKNNQINENPIYYFNFIRTINNIPYESNSIYIGVNSINGELQSYNLVWDDIYNLNEIKNNIKNIKTKEEIKKILLKDISFIPVYLKMDDDIIFAYKLVFNNNKNLVNGLTGDFIK
ncbi:YcdB/YcdC domain-containing protein [Peptostreptococcaceae bacterium AGR-M142]